MIPKEIKSLYTKQDYRNLKDRNKLISSTENEIIILLSNIEKELDLAL